MKMFLKECGSACAVFMACFFFAAPVSAFAMEAPGGGGEGWYYSEDSFSWHYFDEDGSMHTGWLFYDGEWYWFGEDGTMAAGGYQTIDGQRHFFFANGHMACSQYVDFKYFDAYGREDETHDIRAVGAVSASSMDRDLLTDTLYYVPRHLIARFIKEGWEFLFYTEKTCFASYQDKESLYRVQACADPYYKKAKFCDPEAAAEAFGQYLGYSAGVYEEGSALMAALRQEAEGLRTILSIPAACEDERVCFGKLFSVYVLEGADGRLKEAAPETCALLEELIGKFR